MSHPDNAALKQIQLDDELLPRSIETVAAEVAIYGDKIKKTMSQITQAVADLRNLESDLDIYCAIQTSARLELERRLSLIAKAEQEAEYAHAVGAMSVSIEAIPY